MIATDDTALELDHDSDEAYRSVLRLAHNPQREIQPPMLRVFNDGKLVATLNCRSLSNGWDTEPYVKPSRIK